MRNTFMKRLRDRGFIAIIALLFSIGLWYRVVGGEKIEATKTIKLDYRLPKDLTLFSPFPSEVSVRVRGPAPFVNEFQKQDLTVTLDLGKFGIGEHDLGFRAEQFRVPLGIDLTSINPPSLKVFLDREMKKPVDVRPVLSAQLPDGYKIDKYVVQPSSVEIKGSRIRLGVMSSIPTETIYITENSLNQNFDVPLNMDDFWGVELTEKISTVHVEVSLKGPSKTKIIKNIPIRLRVGSGSKSKMVEAEPKRIQLRPSRVNITVEGAETALLELDENSMEVWVQVPHLKSGNQRARLSWKISPDVRILQRSTDTVVVNVP